MCVCVHRHTHKHISLARLSHSIHIHAIYIYTHIDVCMYTKQVQEVVRAALGHALDNLSVAAGTSGPEAPKLPLL